MHGSRTSHSQKIDNFLPAPSLLAFRGCRAKLSFSLFLSPSKAPEFQFQGGLQQLCSFTLFYLILTCFWGWLGFRYNTEPKCLKRAVPYRCAYYLPLDYRRGAAPALLVLITPSEVWYCLSAVPFPTPSPAPIPTGSPSCPQSSPCNGSSIASSSRAAPAREVKSSFQLSPSLLLHSSPMAESLYPSRQTAHLAETLLNTSLSMCGNNLVRKELMCFYHFQLSLNQQEQAHVISLGLKGCRCKSLLFYKLPLYFSSQAIAGLNSLTLSHWGPVRVNALNDKSLTTQRPPCMV